MAQGTRTSLTPDGISFLLSSWWALAISGFGFRGMTLHGHAARNGQGGAPQHAFRADEHLARPQEHRYRLGASDMMVRKWRLT